MKRAEVHLISTGKAPLAQFVKQAALVHPLIDYIHLREKQHSAAELLRAVQQMLEEGVPAAKLVINDRIDVALAIGAGGVQLAWHSLPPSAAKAVAPQLRLGRSIHTPEEVADAVEQGADYVLFGHVFPSGSKPGQPARGLNQLAEVVHCSSKPVIAIGGIEPSNTAEVLAQGAAGIAVMSGICEANDPLSAAKAYYEAVHSAVQRR